MAGTDELIKKNVVDELYWNSSVDASHVKVEVENGVVYLSGAVPNYRARTASAESAAGIRGVLNVRNRVVVDPNHTAGATPDEVIQDTAVKALCWNPDFQGSNITVNVNQGVVVLEGTVGALWKKNLAESVVGQLTGVRKIENLLAVVPIQSPGDEGTARDIVNALARQLGTHSREITVKVKEGVVTLMGAVPDKQAFERAERAAVFTYGVMKVDNQLDLQAPEGKPSAVARAKPK